MYGESLNRLHVRHSTVCNITLTPIIYAAHHVKLTYTVGIDFTQFSPIFLDFFKSQLQKWKDNSSAKRSE